LMMAMTIFMGFDPRLGPDTTDRADNGSVAGSCSRGLPERWEFKPRANSLGCD
jgi:hypothetical protein